MNQQPPEKRRKESGFTLDVQDIFFTIQGEGPFTGKRAVFIRLAGCNLQCLLCDTDYTSKREKMSVVNIVEKVKSLLPPNQYRPELVVITGGEPFRQKIRLLTDLLISNTYSVQIETNGTLYQDLDFKKLTIVCSPKTSELNRELKPHITALKYVVSVNETRFRKPLPETALQHKNYDGLIDPWKDFTGPVYIMPADEKDLQLAEANLRLCVYLSKTCGYILGIQLHKLINQP